MRTAHNSSLCSGILANNPKADVSIDRIGDLLRCWRETLRAALEGSSRLGWCSEIGGNSLLHAERRGTHLVMGCSRGFSRRSVGYVGASDGWQDLMNNFQMDWEFRAAGPGNIALTGEIVAQGDEPFVIAIGRGQSCQSTVANLLQSLAERFEGHRESYVRQWQRTVIKPKYDFSSSTLDVGHLYRLSQ
jgi:glucoamylase